MEAPLRFAMIENVEIDEGMEIGDLESGGFEKKIFTNYRNYRLNRGLESNGEISELGERDECKYEMDWCGLNGVMKYGIYRKILGGF